MVFCGRPSRACERCRARRAKCDLRNGACGQCVRTGVACSGYPDIHRLRIRDESKSVVDKSAKKNSASPLPQYLPLSMDLQARAAFFDYYVFSKCWKFLEPYHHPTDTPKHLTLAIEAVSLAYFWYQVSSDVALQSAREKYILALCMLKKVLRCREEAARESTLLTTLLLDLFEKITDCEPRDNQSWKSHMDGALALVHLRGLDQFQKSSDFDILVRLSSNYLITCAISNTTIPETLTAVHAYIGQNLGLDGPKLQLSDFMLKYVSLSSELRRCAFSSEKCERTVRELDSEIQALDAGLPARWQYSATTLVHKSDTVLDLYIHCYSDSRVCQVRNFLRVIRIFLNEFLNQCEPTSSTDGEHPTLVRTAHHQIEALAREICASVPQYMDCKGSARKRLIDTGVYHHHTHGHLLDVYTLIFPLFVAGRSNAAPAIRTWAIKQLHYISDHFCIRNAEVVARTLELETDVMPWKVYAILGSYAFQA